MYDLQKSISVGSRCRLRCTWCLLLRWTRSTALWLSDLAVVARTYTYYTWMDSARYTVLLLLVDLWQHEFCCYKRLFNVLLWRGIHDVAYVESLDSLVLSDKAPTVVAVDCTCVSTVLLRTTGVASLDWHCCCWLFFCLWWWWYPYLYVIQVR